MIKVLFLAVVASSLALPAAAQSQFKKPEDAIKYRKSALTVIGAHFGRIGNMVNNRAPYDAKAAAEDAEIVAAMSQLPFSAFEPGTDKGETRAKPQIWSESDKFRAAARKMQEDTAKLAAVAKTGNLDSLKVAFGEAGKTCKNCHDSYRED